MKSIGDYNGYEWDDFDFDGKCLETSFLKIADICLARERQLVAEHRAVLERIKDICNDSTQHHEKADECCLCDISSIITAELNRSQIHDRQ